MLASQPIFAPDFHPPCHSIITWPFLRENECKRENELQRVLTIVAVENDGPRHDLLLTGPRLVFVGPFRKEIDDRSLAVSTTATGDLGSSHDLLLNLSITEFRNHLHKLRLLLEHRQVPAIRDQLQLGAGDSLP